MKKVPGSYGNPLSVTVLAIQRDLQILSNPGENTKIRVHDILVLLGEPKKIAALMNLTDNHKSRKG